jgi:hypothetical protein
MPKDGRQTTTTGEVRRWLASAKAMSTRRTGSTAQHLAAGLGRDAAVRELDGMFVTVMTKPRCSRRDGEGTWTQCPCLAPSGSMPAPLRMTMRRR